MIKDENADDSVYESNYVFDESELMASFLTTN